MFSKIFKSRTKEKETNIPKKKIADIVAYSWFRDKTESDFIDFFENNAFEDNDVSVWVEQNINKLISIEFTELIAYFVKKYPEILYQGNTPNFFILGCIEHGMPNMFYDYFEQIIENATFPFMWVGKIMPYAIQTFRWWAVIEVWKNKQINWHPADNFEELCEIIVPLAKVRDPQDNIDLFHLLKMLRNDPIIFERAMDMLEWNPEKFDTIYSHLIPNHIRETFLF